MSSPITNKWKLQETSISGCFQVSGKQSYDHRGHLSESYVQGVIPDFECRQSNVVVSTPIGGNNVLRGIHVAPYKKLVSCIQGTIFDVCVDFRPDSPTYGRHHGTFLQGGGMMLIPEGCGHGYMTAFGQTAVVLYHQGGVWQPDREIEVSAFEDLDVRWPGWDGRGFTMSDKDRKAPSWKNADFSCLTI